MAHSASPRCCGGVEKACGVRTWKDKCERFVARGRRWGGMVVPAWPAGAKGSGRLSEIEECQMAADGKKRSKQAPGNIMI